MRISNIRELKNNPAKIIKEAEKGDVIITSRGKPVAIVKSLSQEDLDNYILLNEEEFKKLMKEAEEEFRAYQAGELKDVKTAKQLLNEIKKEIGSK